MHQAKQQQQRLVQVSKEMSRLLRHAPPAGAMDAQVGARDHHTFLIGCQHSTIKHAYNMLEQHAL